jgi:hypothetical protein
MSYNLLFNCRSLRVQTFLPTSASQMIVEVNSIPITIQWRFPLYQTPSAVFKF